jgi:hypothetical protein
MEQGANPRTGTTIRSTETEGAAAGALTFLISTGLFRCRWKAIFAFMTQGARAADRA